MNTITNDKIILKSVIHLLSLFLVSWSITPYLRRNTPMFVVAILLLVWIIFAGLSAINKKNTAIPKYYLYSFLFIGLIFIYRFIGFSSAAWGNYFNVLMFFFYSWVYYYYLKHMDVKKSKQLFTYGMILSTFNLFSNIYLLYIYPNASVDLNYSTQYFQTNVGGTIFSFYNLLLLNLLLIIKDKVKNNKNRNIMIVLILSITIYIFQAARATSVFLMIITFAFYILNKAALKKPKNVRILIYLFSIIITMLFMMNIVHILKLMSNFVDNERLLIRINAITNTLSSGQSVGEASLTNRLQLYKISIETFFTSFKNFMFGVGYHTTENLSNNWLLEVGVGNHSEIFDLAARYGILGIFSLVSFYVHFIRFTMKKVFSLDWKKLRMIYFIFMIYSVVNTSFDPSVGVLIFLIVPIYFSKFIKQKNELTEEIKFYDT